MVEINEMGEIIEIMPNASSFAVRAAIVERKNTSCPEQLKNCKDEEKTHESFPNLEVSKQIAEVGSIQNKKPKGSQVTNFNNNN
jgi:hypothetical protein